jgi:hypothetical protein
VIAIVIHNKYTHLPVEWEQLVKGFGGTVKTSASAYRRYKHVIDVPQAKVDAFMEAWVTRPKVS